MDSELNLFVEKFAVVDATGNRGRTGVGFTRFLLESFEDATGNRGNTGVGFTAAAGSIGAGASGKGNTTHPFTKHRKTDKTNNTK